MADSSLQQLKKLLEKFSADDEPPSASALRLIHIASQARILTLAAEYAKTGAPDFNTIAEERPFMFEIPTPKSFKMGEFVKIVQLPFESIKFISERTTGWSHKYAAINGSVGFVTSVCSQYDCHIQVFFPEIQLKAEIYSGVLEKTSEVIKPTYTAFLVGDMVTVQAAPPVIQLLQDELDSIPVRFVNKTGRVIGVDNNAVHVTFTGTFSIRINPALLRKSKGDLETYTYTNSKDIKEGDKVKVKKSLKKLMESQKKIHGWKKWMSRLPGKIVRVLIVKEDDFLRVCMENGRSFNLLTDRVMRLESNATEEEDDDEIDDVAFGLDEWVKLKTIPNIMGILKSKSIPLTILEYLEYPAIISSYKHNSIPAISFDFGYSIHVNSSVLERLDNGETKRAQELDGRQKQWKEGDEVYLNLGPPNYVRDILKQQNVAQNIAQALTSTAVFLRFADSQHAIIKCCDGEVRKVEKDYLTYPEKFSGPGEDKVGRVLGDLLSIIEECLDEYHQRLSLPQHEKHLDIGTGIKIICFKGGQPSTVHISIRSPLVKNEDLLKALHQKSSIKFDRLHGNAIRVLKVQSQSTEIILHFCPHGEPEAQPMLKEVLAGFKAKSDTGTMEVTEKERAEVLLTATPPPTVEPPEGDRPHAELAGYEHMELTVEGVRIQIPYRPAPAPVNNGQGQGPRREEVRRPGGTQSEGEINRITIEGDIRNVHINRP